VGVETAFVKVSVTDPLNRYVTGLEKEHFDVFEDKVAQKLTHFSQESAPISVGLLFDVSGSMKDNIHTARNSVVRFLEAGNPEDEFFLVTFNQKTSLVQRFTDQSTEIQNEVSFSQPGGRTALYDAVYLGLQEIKGARNEKKALILITDGEDNSSRYSSSEVREFAKESDVQIYAIGEEGKLGYGRSEIQNSTSFMPSCGTNMCSGTPRPTRHMMGSGGESR
jgi:VWFA-related protein